MTNRLHVAVQAEASTQEGPEPFVPSEEQITWVIDHAIPFDTSEPGGDIRDLSPLRELIGNAQIVALGECTHGTSEIFKMKHRIVEFLAAEMGFTVLAMEANMPEAKKVNDYVLTGKGDPKEALAGMYFWTWNTQEVLGLIRWMREFNSSENGHIEFWGFDMQYPHVAMRNVGEFIKKADKDYMESLSIAYGMVQESLDSLKAFPWRRDVYRQQWRQASDEVLAYLEANQDEYARTWDLEEIGWVIQNARIVLQGADRYIAGMPSRDESMAQNIRWILESKSPGTKIIIWSHNGHISKTARSRESMGNFLSRTYGDRMIVFGFAFHEGKYTARGGDHFELSTFKATPSGPGSLEWVLHNTGQPRLILDLRQVSDKEPVSNWLNRPLLFRQIGSVATDNAFFPSVIAEEYDALIYFERTSPSVLLDTPRPKPGDDYPEY